MKRLTTFVLLSLVLVGLAVLTGCGTAASAGGNGGCNTGYPYCMTYVSGTASGTPNSGGAPAGYTYSGTMVFNFTPAPPINTPVTVIFSNSAAGTSFQATGTATGSSTVSLTVSGNSVSCGIINPPQVTAYFNMNFTSAAAVDTDVTWKTTGCSQ
jgi:hypothetical protein